MTCTTHTVKAKNVNGCKRFPSHLIPTMPTRTSTGQARRSSGFGSFPVISCSCFLLQPTRVDLVDQNSFNSVVLAKYCHLPSNSQPCSIVCHTLPMYQWFLDCFRDSCFVLFFWICSIAYGFVCEYEWAPWVTCRSKDNFLGSHYPSTVYPLCICSFQWDQPTLLSQIPEKPML